MAKDFPEIANMDMRQKDILSANGLLREVNELVKVKSQPKIEIPLDKYTGFAFSGEAGNAGALFADK